MQIRIHNGRVLTLAIIAMVTNMIFIVNIVMAVCVGGGSLSITALPATSNFPTQNTSLSSTTTGIVFSSSLFFEDMRNTTQGFTLTVTATDYVDTVGGINSFAVTNLAIASDDNDTIGLIDCDGANGITLNALSFSNFIDTDVNGTSDSKTLVTGDSTARIGKYSIEPELQITIPARTLVGSYRSTLTFSIQ